MYFYQAFICKNKFVLTVVKTFTYRFHHHIDVMGEADEKSDIDFLVDLAPGRSLLALAGFIAELKEIVGTKIDVVPSDCIKLRSRERILNEAVVL